LKLGFKGIRIGLKLERFGLRRYFEGDFASLSCYMEDFFKLIYIIVVHESGD